MDARERIEEAHGLWELAIARLAAMVQSGASKQYISDAGNEERSAFKHWQKISNEITEG